MPGAPARPTRRQIFGFVAGVVAGAVFALVAYLVAKKVQPDSGLILVSVFLVPAAASALAVVVAGIRGKGSAAPAVLMAVAVVTTMLVGSSVFFHEGAVCIVMAAPIFYALSSLAAVFVAQSRGGPRSNGPSALVIIFPLLLLPIERQSDYPTMHAAVATQLDIDAPIETVWREAIEIRDIQAREQTWTATHALLRVPRPVDAQLIERNGSLTRQATWQGGVQFFEVVTDWRPARSVAWRFDIPEAAANRLLDEHLRLDEGYLRLEGGRYDLEALSPTRTRLRLTTHYSARTPWNAYALAWSELVLGDIHRNVLTIVKRRAET